MESMDWLVPELTLSAEAQLTQNLHDVQKHGVDNPHATVQLACSLLQQNAIQQALIRQAVHRIAELEQLTGLNGVRESRSWWRQLIVELLPRKPL